MKKLFITGGCGYVGSLMIQNFLDKYTIQNIDTQWFGNKLRNNDNLINIKKDIRSLRGEFIEKNTQVNNIIISGSCFEIIPPSKSYQYFIDSKY